MKSAVKLPIVEDVKPLINHRLRITFDDGKVKIFDARPFVAKFKKGTAASRLKDPVIFKTARADTGVEWDDIGFGICPEYLYEHAK